MAEDIALDGSHVRSIQTSIAAVALAILTAAVPEETGFWVYLMILTLILVGYSFVPTLIRS